ncbi:MAG TPA: Maf family nucleotide pyrophosphatase [Gammaproteobacteria bacterium]|nr:Maf family nucleotide pyrophosphatase [Gammaproteobacteria bacterium]
MTPPIVLASSSPYRRELLGRLNLPFDCQSPNIDETPRPGESPHDLAQRLAHSKAEAIAATLDQPALVIGSDQVASINGAPIGKPGNRERARAQLQQASGRTVEFHTAVAVRESGSSREASFTDVTRVHFRTLKDDEIARYLDGEQPYDCAGSFKAEGLGITLFESIESSDPTALIGLPLIELARILREFDLQLP